MDLTELGKKLAAVGLPLLGAALPVPGGAAIGTALAAALGLADAEPDTIDAALQDPDKLQAAREFQAKHEERMLELTLQAEMADRKAASDDIQVVNGTIVEELKYSKDESWLQKSWRPMNGMSLALASLLSVVGTFVLFGLALFAPNAGVNLVTVVSVLPQLAAAVAMILAVPGAAVGVAAWHRGVAQRIEAQGRAPNV